MSALLPVFRLVFVFSVGIGISIGCLNREGGKGVCISSAMSVLIEMGSVVVAIGVADVDVEMDDVVCRGMRRIVVVICRGRDSSVRSLAERRGTR